MKASSAESQDDNWISAKATIIACKLRLSGLEDLSEYRVTFSYSAGNETYKGTYTANSPQECGHTFDIFYDPSNPHKNTGSDVLDNRWLRLTAAALGAAAVLAAIWFWGKQDWF